MAVSIKEMPIEMQGSAIKLVGSTLVIAESETEKHLGPKLRVHAGFSPPSFECKFQGFFELKLGTGYVLGKGGVLTEMTFNRQTIQATDFEVFNGALKSNFSIVSTLAPPSVKLDLSLDTSKDFTGGVKVMRSCR